jgi:hypothetical protein
MNPLQAHTIVLAAVVASAVTLATLVLVWFSALHSLKRFVRSILPEFLQGVNTAVITAIQKGQLPADLDPPSGAPAGVIRAAVPAHAPACINCEHLRLGGPLGAVTAGTCTKDGQPKDVADTCEHFRNVLASLRENPPHE